MRIAICEDNDTQRNLICSYLKQWAEKENTNIDVKTFSSAEAFLFAEEDEKAFDLLLLDIQMKEMTGLELAHKLRRRKNDVDIIFITALREFVFEGYSVEAIEYILKPVNKDKLFAALDKVAQRRQMKQKYIIIENTKINQNDIIYIESQGHYIKINTQNEVLTVKKPISEFLGKLDKAKFVLCHRSYAINLGKVKKIAKEEILLDNEETLPVSRTKYKEINKAFIQYYSGGGKD